MRKNEMFCVGDTVKIEPNLQSGANEFLYVESKRARLDREKVLIILNNKEKTMTIFSFLRT